MQNKISIIIITGNEEKNIKDCLESVRWADEVIVIDSESTDKTVNIAKKLTDKVFVRKWEGYADQKAHAMGLAKNEWILSLDADERVTPELSKEIASINLSIEKASAFKIHRDNYFLGKKITSCGWENDYQLRLFKKSKTKLTDRLVHEGFVVEGSVSKLKNSITHYSYQNLKEGLKKINEYSTLEAQEKYQRKNVNLFTMLFVPVIAFIQHFIFRWGFKDGIYGTMVSIMHATTKLQVQMKMWELKKGK